MTETRQSMSPHGREILIVEDEDDLRNILVELMREHFPDFSIVTAGDGEAALEQINRYTPSLLILNMIMPRKTGAEVLRELSNRE
jgi:CheY-like chemotaxis protein